MGLLKQNCNVCKRPLKNIRSQLKGVGPICEDRFAKCRCPLEPFGWNNETNSPIRCWEDANLNSALEKNKMMELKKMGRFFELGNNSIRGFRKPWWDYDVVNGWLAPLCKRCKGYHFTEGLGGAAPKAGLHQPTAVEHFRLPSRLIIGNVDWKTVDGKRWMRMRDKPNFVFGKWEQVGN